MALPSTKIGPSAGMEFISSPHIRESKTVIMDSGFQVLDSQFFFSVEPWTPDSNRYRDAACSVSCIPDFKAQGFRFHSKNGLDSAS